MFPASIPGCFRTSWVSNLASWLSVCTTTSVGFIQALWLLPQSEDSNTGLNRDYECIEFLGNGAFACHVLVIWCVPAFPQCRLDSNMGLFMSISCHLLHPGKKLLLKTRTVKEYQVSVCYAVYVPFHQTV